MTNSHRETLEALKAAKKAERAESIAKLATPEAGLVVLATGIVISFLYLASVRSIEEDYAANLSASPAVGTVEIPETQTRDYWDSQKPAKPVQYAWGSIEDIIITGDSSEVVKLAAEIRSRTNCHVVIREQHLAWAKGKGALISVYFKGRTKTLEGLTSVDQIELHLPILPERSNG